MSSRLCRRLSMENLLPEEIMFDILSRLPMKTIINCKCLCKMWRNLDLDSHFVHLQLPRSPECILTCCESCDIHASSQSATIKMFETEDQLDHLLHESSRTFICNPITKEYMILPDIQYGHVRYGFGVSVTGEYKVICLCRSEDSFKIMVYTLGTHKWRSLSQEVPYVPYRLDLPRGLFYNNRVHWTVGRANQLFSFSLNDDTFELFPLPHSLQGNVNVPRFLGVLKGCLSLFSSSNRVATIWVMKEHGIKKSWHKELEVKDSIIPPFPGWYPVSLIDGLNDQSILLYMDCRRGKYILLAYFFETNTIEETTIRAPLRTVITYRPSFLKLQKFQPARVYNF